METWLTGHGFSVAGVLPGKQVIEFSGNVGQFRSAFHTQIHQYAVNGETHFANATDPQIPAAIAPVVGGFVALNNFHARNQAKLLGKAQYDRTTDRATPDWTWGTAAGGVNFVLAPQDYAVEYDLNPLYNASTPIKGSGQTIAIINDSNVNIGLVNQFRSLFGLPVNPPQVIIDGNDPGVNGDAVEAYLDVEWAGAVAPEATIDLVIGADTQLQNGLYLAAEHAVYGNLAPVMSISFGYCEQGLGSYNGFWSNLWEQAAAQGTTVMVSSGDAGSAGCDDDNTQYFAEYGQNVNGFASTPYNVAVGGTDFYYSFWNSSNVTLSSFAPYWTTTPQQAPAASLKAYLAEQPWNDSQFGDDVSQTYADSNDTATSIAAGGGGASNAAVCSGSYLGNSCTGTTSGYPKPSWQTGTGVPSDGVRDLPDVSLFASNGSNYTFYVLCAQDGDCQPASGNNIVQISGVGGTSASSPSFAGMMALVNQKWGPQGQANYVLYPLAKQFPAAFHDVTEGSNTVPCASGSTNCITAANGLGYTVTDPYYGTATEGEIGTGTTPEYNAGVGYDLASGLGTIDANVLVTDWPKVKFDATTTTLNVSPTSFAHGTAPTISGTVSGTGTPAGDVALLTSSTEPMQQGQTFFTLSNGAYSSSTVNYLPGGTYNVWTQYGGDGTNGLSKSTPVQITVSPEASTLNVSVLQGGSTVTTGSTFQYGSSITLDAQPIPTADVSCSSCSWTYPTGTVVFSDNGTAVNTAVLNAEGDAEYTPQPALKVGSHVISASYSGDNSYNASTGTGISFSVIQATPEVLIALPYTEYYAGMTETLSVLVESLGNGAAPTGSVSLSGAPSALTTTSATLVPGVDPNNGTTVGIATFTIPSTAAANSYTITATYTPDSASSANYASASSGAYSLQIDAASGINTTTTGTATASSTSPKSDITVSGTVTAASGGQPAGDLYVLVPILQNQSTAEEGVVTSVSLTPGTGNTSSFTFTVNSGSLTQGVNQITLQYLPSTSSSDNPSAAVVTISNPLADFSLIANTTILPVTSGASASTTINLASLNTFAGAVSLTCKAPTGWTCTIPSSETLDERGQRGGHAEGDGANDGVDRQQRCVRDGHRLDRRVCSHAGPERAGDQHGTELYVEQRRKRIGAAGGYEREHVHHYRDARGRVYGNGEPDLRADQSSGRDFSADVQRDQLGDDCRNDGRDGNADDQHHGKHDSGRVHDDGDRHGCGDREDHVFDTRGRDGEDTAELCVGEQRSNLLPGGCDNRKHGDDYLDARGRVYRDRGFHLLDWTGGGQQPGDLRHCSRDGDGDRGSDGDDDGYEHDRHDGWELYGNRDRNGHGIDQYHREHQSGDHGDSTADPGDYPEQQRSAEFCCGGHNGRHGNHYGDAVEWIHRQCRSDLRCDDDAGGCHQSGRLHGDSYGGHYRRQRCERNVDRGDHFGNDDRRLWGDRHGQGCRNGQGELQHGGERDGEPAAELRADKQRSAELPGRSDDGQHGADHLDPGGRIYRSGESDLRDHEHTGKPDQSGNMQRDANDQSHKRFAGGNDGDDHHDVHNDNRQLHGDGDGNGCGDGKDYVEHSGDCDGDGSSAAGDCANQQRGVDVCRGSDDRGHGDDYRDAVVWLHGQRQSELRGDDSAERRQLTGNMQRRIAGERDRNRGGDGDTHGDDKRRNHAGGVCRDGFRSGCSDGQGEGFDHRERDGGRIRTHQ